MTDQQKNEVIKALAYGESTEQIAEAEGIEISQVQEIQQTCTAEITEEKDMLKKAGYL